MIGESNVRHETWSDAVRGEVSFRTRSTQSAPARRSTSPRNGEDGIRNTGDGHLRFFYAFAVGSFDQVEYRFAADQ